MRTRRIVRPKLRGGAFALGVDAGAVVGLRLAKLARGGAAARRESMRMVGEKRQAAFDASVIATRSIVSGEAHCALERVLALYRNRVAANAKRLSRKP